MSNPGILPGAGMAFLGVDNGGKAQTQSKPGKLWGRGACCPPGTKFLAEPRSDKKQARYLSHTLRLHVLVASSLVLSWEKEAPGRVLSLDLPHGYPPVAIWKTGYPIYRGSGDLPAVSLSVRYRKCFASGYPRRVAKLATAAWISSRWSREARGSQMEFSWERPIWVARRFVVWYFSKGKTQGTPKPFLGSRFLTRHTHVDPLGVQSFTGLTTFAKIVVHVPPYTVF